MQNERRCRLCTEEHDKKDHKNTADSWMTEEGSGIEENTEQRMKSEMRCINCRGDYLEQRHSQMIARENNYTEMEDGTSVKRRKPLKKKDNGINETSTGKTGNENLTAIGLNKMARDKRRNENSSISFKNLLNYKRVDGDDHMEVEAQESTVRSVPGNIP